MWGHLLKGSLKKVRLRETEYKVVARGWRAGSMENSVDEHRLTINFQL